MRKGKRYRKTKKPAMLLVSLIMVLTVAVGGSLAYLVTKTDPVENTFTVEQVPITVDESFSGSTKSDVKIKHKGDSETGRDAYVRAAVVVNWVDGEGNVYNQKPVKGTDYTLEMNNDSWAEKKGYWYYLKPLAPGKETAALVKECKDLNTAPDGYQLSVEILAQSIQADGVDPDGNAPVKLAWGVTRNANRTLSVN